MSNPATERVTISSYASLFRPDRRIYQVEGHRIPWPGGLPLVVLLYTVGALVGVVLVGRLPIVGDAFGVVHPVWRYVFVPVMFAVVAWHVRPDGRSLPAWLATQAGWGLRALRQRGSLRDGQAVGHSVVLPLRSEAPRLDRPGRVVGRGRIVFDLPMSVRMSRRGHLVARVARRGEKATRVVRLDPTTPLEVRS